MPTYGSSEDGKRDLAGVLIAALSFNISQVDPNGGSQQIRRPAPEHRSII